MMIMMVMVMVMMMMIMIMMMMMTYNDAIMKLRREREIYYQFFDMLLMCSFTSSLDNAKYPGLGPTHPQAFLMIVMIVMIVADSRIR